MRAISLVTAFATPALLITFLLVPVCYAADPFPVLDTENLLGKKVSLPDAAKGHAAVLVIGFTHASNTQSKAWTTPLEADNVWLYSIAVLEDAPRLVRPMAIAGMKGGVDKTQRGHYLVVTSHEAELKAAAGFSTPDDAYIVLLDAAGAIRWRFHGAFTDAAHAELKSQLATLQP